MKTIDFLRQEIEILKSRIQEHDTGHIHTAIYVLEGRLKEELDKVNKQDLDLSIAKCRLEIDSGYNDGWTKQFYEKELERLTKVKECWDHYSDLPSPKAYVGTP